MITSIVLLLINLIVFITASISLSAANKCKTVDLSIVKNTDYFLMIFSIIFIALGSYNLYYKGADSISENLNLYILIGGIILLQFGIVQYASLSALNCGETQKDLENCYKSNIVLGIIMLSFGGYLYYDKQK